MGDSLRLVFLIPRGQTEITASEGLERAFETCRQFGLEAEWIEEVRNIASLHLNSSDWLFSYILFYTQYIIHPPH